MSFPWNSPPSDNQCGCRIPVRQKSRSLFRRITGATGQWISDLLGAGTGQLVVRNEDSLGYLKPNCEGYVKLDTDGNASVGSPAVIEGIASGNPTGFGYVPFLELFQKEICNPDGGAPTEEQWMRIKALMPQWIATGELAVLSQKDCASEELRFDFLQPCPLPTNGCPPDGIGYLASAVTDNPTPGGCSQKVRRWYWVTGLSIPDTSLIKNEDDAVDLLATDIWQVPVLRKRGGCWFFEAVKRSALFGDGLVEFRTTEATLYTVQHGPQDVTTPVAIPGYADHLALAQTGSKIYGIFSGWIYASAGASTTGEHIAYINGIEVGRVLCNLAEGQSSSWGERTVELTSGDANIRDFTHLLSGPNILSGTLDVRFHGFKLTPK